MENDSSGKAERENYETQNDCSTAFRNPAVLGSWMRKRSSDRQEHRSIVFCLLLFLHLQSFQKMWMHWLTLL
jgi:hypothetical protein